MASRIPLVCSKSRWPFSAALVLAAALAFLVPTARQARAQGFDQILGQLQDVQNSLVTAAVQSQHGEPLEALTTIDGALAMLQSIRENLADPALAEEFGRQVRRAQKGVRATEKKINSARVSVDKGRKVKIQLRKMKVAAKAALKAASKLGRPVLAEIDARTAGFHKPGDQVRFQIYNADGTPCPEYPEVVVSNQPLSAAIDLNSVLVDEASGIITLTMGQEQGGGSVTVTACGQTATRLLYNYGPTIPSGLPNGFPTNLPKGRYLMTYSASGTGISIPETPIGTIELTDLKSFAKQLIQAFNSAMNSVSVPGCSQRVNYSSYDGTSFTVTYSVTCTVDEYSATVTVVFRIRRV